MKKTTNQHTHDIDKSIQIWENWCTSQNLEPITPYVKSTQKFYFRFTEGRFKGLVGRAYWASIKRGSKVRMTSLTPFMKYKYFYTLGISKGIKLLEPYTEYKKGIRFIGIKGHFEGCEGVIKPSDLVALTSIDTRSLTPNGRKRYFDNIATKRKCVITSYPEDYKIKNQGKHTRVEAISVYGEHINISSQDFLATTSPFDGSWLSYGARIVKEILTELGIVYTIEKSIRTQEGKVQRLDFYFELYNKKYAIEYMGAQHYKEVTLFNKHHDLAYIQKLDTMKKEYCNIHQIELLYITYKHVTHDSIREKIIDFINK